MLTLLLVGITCCLLVAYSISDSSVPADNSLSINHQHQHQHQHFHQSRSNDQKIHQQEKRPTKHIKIAHAVSLITCQKASRIRGFLDALIILRHSIHQNSIHGHFSNSNYSYQMFAFVHESDAGCVTHVPLLRRLGYIPLVRPTPVNVSHIVTNEWYRRHVPRENCCGDAEFIKLYAYNLADYPVVVHWDLDVAVLQPMDEIYDAMLYDKDSAIGRSARQRLQVQRPSHPLPDRIDAYFTRDVTSSYPWEHVQGVQGGFLAVRPNPHHLELYRQFILEANYTPGGRGPYSGWGGLGYGGFQGAMAYQGVVAYFYDRIHPGHSIELDVCRWNQVVADVIYRGPERPEMMGQCRQYNRKHVASRNNRPELGGCEDCRVLPVEETKTVHFTACKKPWDCTLPYPRVPGPKMKAHTYRLQEYVRLKFAECLLWTILLLWQSRF